VSIAFLVLGDRDELVLPLLLVLLPLLLLVLILLLLLLLPLALLLLVVLPVLVRFPLLDVPLRLAVEEEEDFLGISQMAQHNI
jgi:ABC-type bacteriocin/lantibiotic exporter with double-glycine peptidase domain